MSDSDRLPASPLSGGPRLPLAHQAICPIEQPHRSSSHRLAQDGDVLRNQQQADGQELDADHRQEREEARDDAEDAQRQPYIAR